MPCGEEMHVMLSRYVDNELSQDDRKTVDEHLTGCEGCRSILSLFQKNDSLLANALSTESFGNVVIESVMKSIDGEDPATEARPVEGLLEWLRSRPFIPLSAAAVLLAGLVALLAFPAGPSRSELALQVERLRETVNQLGPAVTTLQQDKEKLESLLNTRHVQSVLSGAPQLAAMAYMEPDRGIMAMAKFDAKNFESYDIYRRADGEKDDRYVKLNGDRLPEPGYMDATAKPGQGYLYKFRAWRTDGGAVESVPLFYRLPAAREQSGRILCEETSVPRTLAVFIVEKMVNGKPVSQKFNVLKGQRVGAPRSLPGLGEVDFTTPYVLVDIEEKPQILETRYAAPLLDDEGNPITKRIEKGAPVPETVSRELVIGRRLNMRAALRPADASNDGPVAYAWKGSWMPVWK